jgi:hypothetical protein
MAINIYPAVFEFSINAKKKYDIIFFAQLCNASLVLDNGKWQYNDNFMPIFSFVCKFTLPVFL